MVSPAAESKVWGAVYIPSRAYNAYQMWNEYQPAESERDLGYAARLRLNALRVWLSYEYWLENAPELEERFRHLLMAADTFGMKIMPSLFETCGVQPTREAMLDKNPLTAVSVASPNRIVTNPDLWEEEDYIFYMDATLDVLQHHENFPPSAEHASARFEKLANAAAVLGKPVWVSEWQRIRDPQFGKSEGLADLEWEPDYAGLASILQSYDVGGFFWSLMIKPAYLRGGKEH